MQSFVPTKPLRLPSTAPDGGLRIFPFPEGAATAFCPFGHPEVSRLVAKMPARFLTGKLTDIWKHGIVREQVLQ